MEEKVVVAAASGDATTSLSGSLELDSTVVSVSELGLDGSSWCKKWLESGWDP